MTSFNKAFLTRAFQVSAGMALAIAALTGCSEDQKYELSCDRADGAKVTVNMRSPVEPQLTTAYGYVAVTASNGLWTETTALSYLPVGSKCAIIKAQ